MSVTTSSNDFFTLKNWKIPTKGTTDYFNTCAKETSGVSVPKNFSGFAYPKSGEGYVGITNPRHRWREYVQCQLLTPLKAKEEYYVEFWVTHAERSKFCISQIGLALTVSKPPANGSRSLTVTPQIHSTECISDTANWTRIAGVFTAEGGEKWVTIGCFVPGTEVFSRIKPIPKHSNIHAYYYIDDVYVGIKNPDEEQLPLTHIAGTTEVVRSYVLSGVHFAKDKSDLSTSANGALDSIIVHYRNCGECHFEVIGHTDTQGEEEHNMVLSKERATAVASYLIEHGIPTDNMLIQGLGSARPIASNETEEERALNRRVEIHVHEVRPPLGAPGSKPTQGKP